MICASFFWAPRGVDHLGSYLTLALGFQTHRECNTGCNLLKAERESSVVLVSSGDATKFHKPSGTNHRHVLSPRAGGRRSKIEVSAGRGGSWGASAVCWHPWGSWAHRRAAPSLPPSPRTPPCVHVCLCSKFPFHKDTSVLDPGPHDGLIYLTLTASAETPLPSEVTHRYWGLKCQHVSGGRTQLTSF